MTIRTDDAWVAALEGTTGPTPAFRILDGPEPRDLAAHCGPRKTHAESDCSIVLSGVVYRDREVDARNAGAEPNDAAVVLRAYLREGDRCLAALRGIFSFVLWDARAATLLAVRDRLGIFPLFYAKDSGAHWLFSPTVAALVAQPAVSRSLDTAVIAERLFDVWVNGEETEYLTIRRVLPGHALTIRRNGHGSCRYWNPPPANLHARDGDEIVDRFEETFDRAVARACQQGRTGIFLSGGIDSISVASVAARLARESHTPPPIALSLLYADPDFHEADTQRAVAVALGLPARQLPLADAIGQQSATESLLDANADWPLPTLNIWQPAFLRLAQEARTLGCEVILTGGGGDEWLGVTPFLAADLIGHLRFVDLVRFGQRTLRSYDIGYLGLLRTYGWTFGLKPHLARIRDRLAPLVGYDVDRWNFARRTPAWLAPEPALRRAIAERCVAAWRADRARRAESPSYYDYEARKSLDHPVVVGEIEHKFHVGQRAGLRMLEPFWDGDLVDLLYAIHPDALSRGGFSKGLVHRVVRRALPDLPLIRQRKIALSMAYQDRVRREGKRAWSKMNGVSALADMGVVDGVELRRTVQRRLANGNNRGLWLIPYILSVEAWVRAHG